MEKYPIGRQDFKTLREGGFIYVDKTHYISQLIEKGKYYFLSRPRRFGKSLFLSTLEYYFRGDKDLFKGLSIEKEEELWVEYPVIHIDFGESNYPEETYLEAVINRKFEEIEKFYKIQNLTPKNLNDHFARLIQSLYEVTGKQVVILIDEYEKPVIDNIGNPDKIEKFQEILRGFYGILKSYDKYLKFVFLTGITKFGKMSIFSALNNLNDISMDMDFGAICGITEEELLSNFEESIRNLAEFEEIDYKEAVNLLKKNYDGYHFNRNCPDIYNPFSILCVMKEKEIKPYWSATGTPSLLAKLLVEKNYDLENLNGIKANVARLMDIGNQFDDPVSLFYQTGYLTIKGYDKLTKRYTLGFPNEEIEVTFAGFIIPYYQKARALNIDSYSNDFIDGIIDGNPKLAINALEAFSASINYDIIQAPEVERHFQNMIFMFSRLLLPYATEVKTEHHTSDGRIDLLIKTDHFIYIIEIKRDGSPEDAIKQIEEKYYGLQFKTDPRKVYYIGLNFSTEKRRLEGYAIKG